MNEIITKILLYSNTWDNYELSILFLHMVGNITITFSLKDTFINKLINILSKNLSPDPSKRDTLKNSLENLQKMDYIDLINKFEQNFNFLQGYDINNEVLDKIDKFRCFVNRATNSLNKYKDMINTMMHK